MPNEPSRDNMQQLWQDQEVEAMRIPIEEIRRRATAFQGKIQRRNLREYLACVVVIVGFTYLFTTIPEAGPRISFGLIIAGTIYVAWHLLTQGAASSVPADMGRVSCLEFHKRELERQRNLLGSVWRWYLGPLIPGIAAMIIGSIISSPPERRWFQYAFAAFAAALFWGIGDINKRAARRLDRQIEEIRSLEENGG
ncbi:MAG: hypothetical protein JOY54_03405 [Acidobacteriaceae bacterium]|nr:hypothetical protein [Acidobacteriaceae bacterium]